MKIFRPEHFGGVLYDTDNLRFELVSEEESSLADKILDVKLHNRKDILVAPIRIYYELNTDCNLRCKHCFVSSSQKSDSGLSTEGVFSLLDDFSREGVLDIRFTGGEPTKRQDLFQILSRAKELGFSVSLNTNGVYEDPQFIANSLASLNLEQVTLSLDGVEETHDFFRGKGSFQQLMNSVKLMNEKGVNLRFNTVINKLNVNQIPALLELATLYVKEINFFYMRPVGRAVALNDLSLDFDSHLESAISTITLRDKYPCLNIMHFEQSFIERTIEDDPLKNELRKGLPYGNTTLGVDCRGNAWPHGYSPYQDSNLNLGSVLEKGLRQIWSNSVKLDSMRTWFRQLMNRCEACSDYRSNCAGLNFEMEVAKLVGDVQENPYCRNNLPVPKYVFKAFHEVK